MPAIREYNNPIDQIRPNNAGAGAMADLAGAQSRAGYYQAQQIRERGQDFQRAISDVGQKAASWYEDNQVKMEISQIGTLITGKQKEYTEEWQRTTANTDPNDSSAAPKFMAKIEADLEKIYESATTYDGKLQARKYINSVTADWHRRVLSDSGVRSAEAIKNNVQKIVTNSVSSVTGDPTSIDNSIALATDIVGEMVKRSPELGAATSAKMRTDLIADISNTIAVKGIMEMIKANPDAGEVLLKSGRFDKHLEPKSRTALEKYPDAVRTQRREEASAARSALKAQQAEAVQNVVTDIYQKDVLITQDGFPIPGKNYFEKAAQLGQLPGGADDARATIAAGHQMRKQAEKREVVVDDPDTYNAFVERVFKGTGDPEMLTQREVNMAFAQRRINKDTKSFLLDVITKDANDPVRRQQNRLFDEKLRMLKPEFITSPYGASDKTGASNYSEYHQVTRQRYTQGISNGIAPERLLDVTGRDPNSIFKDKDSFKLTMAERAERIRKQYETKGRERAVERGILPDENAGRTKGPLPQGQTQLYDGREGANETSPIDAMAGPAPGGPRYEGDVNELYKKLFGGK